MVTMQYYYYHSVMFFFFNCYTDADVAHAFTILAATDSKNEELALKSLVHVTIN